MLMFMETEGTVLLVQNGVYNEVKVCRYLDRLYGKIGKDRYVELHRDHYTSNPKTMWKLIAGIHYEVDNKSGAIILA
jgi:hypothetical protein